MFSCLGLYGAYLYFVTDRLRSRPQFLGPRSW